MPNSQGQDRRLFALRGAVQAEGNDRQAILTATEKLMRALLERNSLAPEAMVSCVFTTTADLDAEFPAVVVRELGLEALPSLCSREIAVPGSMERVIRVMLHYYAPGDTNPVHVYIGSTQRLRPDLNAAR
jgi:chorismate mutase